MSVIGSRFRIRLAEVRSCFVVSDVTSHDAWISTLPHSNVYFQHVEDSFTGQMLHAECGTFGRVITHRILTKPGRTYKCAMVKFGSIRGALAATVGMEKRHPEWRIACATRDASPAVEF